MPNAVVVVFLCLGSLGDVLPVLAVARRLSVRYRPHLVTHALYQERLAPFLPSTTPFTGLPLSPLPPPDAGPEHVQAELEACLGACRAALCQAQQPKSPGPSLLCANLVAKFAYHIAGVLGVPFALLAPSIPPPGPAPSAATVKALVGPNVLKSERCCGESGTLGVTRPDISTQVRFRKEEELRKNESELRAQAGLGAQENLKILTSCPSCLQGLTRYGDDLQNGLLEADYIVVEMARKILGENWLPEYVARANAGGIERVLV